MAVAVFPLAGTSKVAPHPWVESGSYGCVADKNRAFN